MKNLDFKIFLPVAGYVLLVVSVLALQGVIAGIGLGIAGLLVFGPNVVDMKGKTGGIIYGKNKSGSYSKARIKPRNPNSNAQSANRQLHREIMLAWKRTEVNQAAYNIYASLHPVQNKIGHTICLSGINWFVRINRMARKANPNCGLILRPTIDDTVFPFVTGVTVSASASPTSLIVAPIKYGEYLEGMRLEVIATRPMSYGVSSPFGFRSIGVYDPNSPQSAVHRPQTTVDQIPVGSSQEPSLPSEAKTLRLTGIDITADYLEKFKELPAGMKIFVKVRLIMTTGERNGFVGDSSVVH